jgi:spermidine/putrescine transport system ATP-binding protein
VVHAADDEVHVDVHGTKVRATRVSSAVRSGEAWLGVRPEKIHLHRAGNGVPEGSNSLTGGRVTDVSFVGVSTQYLLRMPWQQELMVFEQNTGGRDSFAVGDQATLSWSAEHTFLLDAAQDAYAGAELEDAD